MKSRTTTSRFKKHNKTTRLVKPYLTPLGKILKENQIGNSPILKPLRKRP